MRKLLLVVCSCGLFSCLDNTELNNPQSPFVVAEIERLSDGRIEYRSKNGQGMTVDYLILPGHFKFGILDTIEVKSPNQSQEKPLTP